MPIPLFSDFVSPPLALFCCIVCLTEWVIPPHMINYFLPHDIMDLHMSSKATRQFDLISHTQTKTHITHRDQHHLFRVYIRYLDYTEWIICWYQKFALQSSTMSLLLKNYWHVETTYLLIKFSNTKLLWNTKKGVNKINGVNHVCNTWMVNGVWK